MLCILALHGCVCCVFVCVYVCVCMCVFVCVPSHIANLIFRSEAVGVVTDEERRKMRNRERAFVRESAEAKGQEPDHHGYRMRTESGPQTINFQPAVEPTEEGVGQRDDIQDGIARQAKSGDKESSHGDEESSHGDREGSQPPESKEEEVSIKGVWQRELVSGLLIHGIGCKLCGPIKAC